MTTFNKTSGIIICSKTSVSSLPTTISDSRITEGHVPLRAILSNPAAQLGDWTVTTSAGEAVISGSIGSTTNITLYLGNSAISD